ncbi:MAG: hypothetical protein VZR53_06730 [Prevotella sp.]|jgi:hypothetical protein|nr:hypothetical protein [Prevotella sp.]
MKLYEAVKQVITQFGEQTVVESRLVNLLSDFLAFEDYPAVQHILKEFVAGGYSQQLLDCCLNKLGNDYLLCIDKIETDFVQNKRFKKDLSSYAIECLLYGLGKVDKVNEPFSNGYNPFANESSDILDTLNQQLADLKKQYIDYLDRLAILPKDPITEPAGYYSANSLNVLYGIELKIRVIASDLGLNEPSWGLTQRKQKIAEFEKIKADAVNKAIDKKKKEYEAQIDSLVAQYSKYVKDNEDVPLNDGSSTLHFVGDEIIKLYKELNIDYSSDNYWNIKEDDFTQKKLKVREQVAEKRKKEYIDSFDSIVRDYRDYIKKQKQIPQNDGFSKLKTVGEKLFSLYTKLGLALPDNFFDDYQKKFIEEKEKAIEPLIKDLENTYSEEIKDVISQYKSALFANNAVPEQYGQDKLVHIEKRIRTVYEKAGINYPQIEFIRKSLDSLEVQKKTLIAQLVEKLKKQYLHVLQEGITIPSNFYFKRSGYYNKKTTALLDQHASTIKQLCDAANIKEDGFCEREKENLLAQHEVDSKTMRNQIIWKLVVPVIIASFITFYGLNYASSTGEIAEFDKNMSTASSLLGNGDITGAMNSYMIARDSYDGSYRPTSYRGEAGEKIEETFKILTQKCNDLIEQRDLIGAKKLVESIPPKLIEENADIASGIATINQDIVNTASHGVEELITNIASNGGKLDESGKTYLDQLLQLTPNNYWLNFVKNKEK